jgi:hypothetical protein
MDVMIKQENFLNNLFSLYDETFENHHGIYLDNNTSLLTTLETISAQEPRFLWRQMRLTGSTGHACNLLS